MPALNFNVDHEEEEEDQNDEEIDKKLSNRTPKLVDLNSQIFLKQTNPSSQRNSSW
jgi:hypothetical protein